MEGSKKTIYSVASSILRKLDKTRDLPATRARLAKIRNSINKDTPNEIESISFVFSNMPEELVGNSGNLNDYEKAILTAVQMYALHQQGNSDSVLKLDYSENEVRKNMGASLSVLRSQDDQAIDRRFNVMITSSNFKELTNHLRQIIKILKSKSSETVDYASLAEDLYWFLKNQKENVKIKWSRSFYSFKKKKEEGEN